MDKSKLIIVEGPQGVGKTTLVEYLRENIASSDLYRLAGIKDKTPEGLKKNIKRYDSLSKYLKKQATIGENAIFDRTFFSEKVFCSLGYKQYNFDKPFEKYVKQMSKFKYEIHYFSLYLADASTFEKRLERDQHHGYQKFSVENSINQQNAYKNVVDYLKKYPAFHVHEIAMDDFVKAYAQINEILGIEIEKNKVKK